jgi:hypothetical protein
MTGPSETSAARHDVRRLYGTPRVTLGCGHHGAPRLRLTTGRMVGGRGSGDDRTTHGHDPLYTDGELSGLVSKHLNK